MSKYTIKGVGFKFKQRTTDTIVYYGDEVLCQLFKSPKDWAVVVNGDELKGLRMVEGFRTRWDCIMYSLKVRGVIGE